MNSNPLEARLARRRKRKPGDMKALQVRVWTASEAACALLESESLDERLRACHAVFQGARRLTRRSCRSGSLKRD